MNDELLDLVDENDEIIGTINRKDYASIILNSLGYIRAAELFILNSEAKLWIPVRTLNKTITPGGYDYSAAGHVGSGTDYLQTIIRETKEEINLEMLPTDVEFVAKLKSKSTRYIRTIYLLRSDETPVFNLNDYISAAWLTPTELLNSIDNGHPAKSHLRETVVVLQNYLDC